MGSEQYCLRWTNHQTSVLGVFRQLQEAGSLVDVTLASAEGLSLRAHKVVLSACSSYFRSLFLDHPTRHPIVILKDVSFEELRTLVDFMYRGEVNVETCRLSALLKTAESLQVKGLAEMKGENSPRSAQPSSPAPGPSPPSPQPGGSPRPPQQPPPPVAEEEDTASSDHSQPPLDPTPGPSSLPPVQEAPLSLKKEVVDWDRNDEKSCSTAGQSSSSEYSHPPRDPEVCIVEGDDPSIGASGSPGLGPWLYGEGLLRLLGAGLDQLAVRCSLCLAAFPSPWLLDQHSSLQHPGQPVSPVSPHRSGETEKPFRCEQCGQSYRYRSAYLKHREQNHRARLPADKLFTCDVCGMQFRYLKSFKKHRLNHTLERLQGGRPKEESEVSSSVEVGADSGRAGSRAESSSSRAESSGRRIDGQSDQDDTVDSADGPGDSQASLLGLLATRQRQPRSFACPFCGKCVRSKENLKLHVRKHTGERPFACLFCGRAFGGKSDLTRHLRIHTGERPYHCEMCGKCFARADYLSKHLTTHIHHN